MKKTLIIAILAVFAIMGSNVISQAKTANTTEKAVKNQVKAEAPVKDSDLKTKPEKPSNDKDKQPPKDFDGKTPPEGVQPPADFDGKTPPDGKQPPKSDGSTPPSKDLKDKQSSK